VILSRILDGTQRAERQTDGHTDRSNKCPCNVQYAIILC